MTRKSQSENEKPKPKNLNRASILGGDDLGLTEVNVPEWGGSVHLRGLTGGEREQWEMYFASVTHEGKPAPGANLRASVLVIALCDENGDRLFDNKDIKELAAKNGDVIGRLFDVAAKLSGLDDDNIKTASKN